MKLINVCMCVPLQLQKRHLALFSNFLLLLTFHQVFRSFTLFSCLFTICILLLCCRWLPRFYGEGAATPLKTECYCKYKRKAKKNGIKFVMNLLKVVFLISLFMKAFIRKLGNKNYRLLLTENIFRLK